MAIREFSLAGVSRAKIAFFKELPPASDLSRFTERKFQCQACTETDLLNPDYVKQLDAVVFSQNPTQRNALSPILAATVKVLLNHGVRVYVRIAPDPNETTSARNLIVNSMARNGVPLANITPAERELIPRSLREREGSLLPPYVYIVGSAVNWVELAHIVCDNPAENIPNSELSIDGYDFRLLEPMSFDEIVLLIQRSFYDCREIHFKTLVPGLSGAPVFKAYATLSEGLVGDWPYLHFIKIGPRKKIADEYDKYVGRAIDYVPFHLGPRLRLDRCNLGSTLGVLVGDFVEGAEPIRDSAPAGRATHAIANLFDKTLGPWRKQAKTESIRTLAQFLEDKWLYDDQREIELPSDRATIVTRLGGDLSVAPMRTIASRCIYTPVLCAPAHGDLHATNVLVRGGDAIIIDFEKMTDRYPLLYDPASLEGGLLVEALRHDRRSDEDPAALLAAIAPLYHLSVLEELFCPCRASDPLAWFHECIGQIRTLSRPLERPIGRYGQYAMVLAMCLVRKGCNPHGFEAAQENLRAIAFVLGQRIFRQLDEQLSNHN